MKKILVIPDSFKGTMSSSVICGIVSREIHRIYPAAQVVTIPVADGGEGSVEAFLAALGGRKVHLQAQGPFGEPVDSFYGLLPDGTAVIEMAACAGLPLAGAHPSPDRTTTYGVGQLMGHALGQGCKKMILGLGGSATNDMGAGAAAALGAKFYNRQGESFVPVGKNLGEISRIDLSELRRATAGVAIIAMCDIDNPLYGPAGAACVFAPQKGAGPDMVRLLDEQLRQAAETIHSELGIEVAQVAGAGAAGGMGAGMLAFFGAELKMGIETVLDTVRFEDLLQQADLVITGEGKLDSQSLRGKVVLGVSRRAKAKQVPVVALVGDIGEDIQPVYDQGVSGVFSINRVAVPYREARLRAEEDLALTVNNLLRFMQVWGAGL